MCKYSSYTTKFIIHIIFNYIIVCYPFRYNTVHNSGTAKLLIEQLQEDPDVKDEIKWIIPSKLIVFKLFQCSVLNVHHQYDEITITFMAYMIYGIEAVHRYYEAKRREYTDKKPERQEQVKRNKQATKHYLRKKQVCHFTVV